MLVSSLPRVYVCVISRYSMANWDICRSVCQYGFTDHSMMYAKQVKPGDFAWFHLGSQGFVALARVTSGYESYTYGEKAPWDDGRAYAGRINVEFLSLLETPIPIDFSSEGGEYRKNRELGISATDFQRGFCPISPAAHIALILRSDGQVPKDHATTLLAELAFENPWSSLNELQISIEDLRRLGIPTGMGNGNSGIEIADEGDAGEPTLLATNTFIRLRLRMEISLGSKALDRENPVVSVYRDYLLDEWQLSEESDDPRLRQLLAEVCQEAKRDIGHLPDRHQAAFGYFNILTRLEERLTKDES